MAPRLRSYQLHLHHNIDNCEWRGPHECHELCCGGSDKGSGRPDSRMHPRRFRLEAEWRIRGREGEGVRINGGVNLFHRRLYDACEGFQLCQGILRSASVECIVEHFNVSSTWRRRCGTHLAGASDVADCKGKGVGSKKEGDIVNDESRAMLKGR